MMLFIFVWRNKLTIMKKSILAFACFISLLCACKKDNKKPATPISNQQSSANQMLLGKWTIVKDSLQTFDYTTPIVSPQHLVLSGNDFVVFNNDSTATVSSQLGFAALYTDFGKFYINPNAPADIPRSISNIRLRN
jgi:hypothetical protein